MSTTIKFLQEIRDGAKLLGIAPSYLCQMAVGNSKLMIRLEAGGKVTLDTVDKIRAYIAANRPQAPSIVPPCDPPANCRSSEET
jgi:hypothetical protein